MSNDKRTGYWTKVWERHRESMLENLRRLNEGKRAKSSEKMALIKAVLPQLPIGPMTSTELRNALAEAWAATYGEPISQKQAWNLVRAGRYGKVIPDPGQDGNYTVHPLPE